MSTASDSLPLILSGRAGRLHPWLKRLHVTRVEGPSTPVSAAAVEGIAGRLAEAGHDLQAHPVETTGVLLTTARFGEPLQWRKAPFFQARRQYKLRHSPTVFTVVHVLPSELDSLASHFQAALAKDPLDLQDFAFPGLGPDAHRTLVEQGRRGGPILSIQRLMQAQALCLRVLVAVGVDQPDYIYHFDLVGSYATSTGTPEGICEDAAWRITAAASAESVAKPVMDPRLISANQWEGLSTPSAMRAASREFSRRGFFTEMVRVSELVQVPALGDAIAAQYSEGCFATWEPELDALITTVTGSARPVDKENITDDDLAVVVGTAPDGTGPVVRHVEGLANDPPSSEGFEMLQMDRSLPQVQVVDGAGRVRHAPVARSKLHSHRGVAAYDPRHVEYIPMAERFFHYPVACGTLAQAEGLVAAFGQSAALQQPSDPRQVVFTILPTHGVFVAEKWQPGKAPFQLIWEYMDAGYLQIDRLVAQGPGTYFPAELGR